MKIKIEVSFSNYVNAIDVEHGTKFLIIYWKKIVAKENMFQFNSFFCQL